MAQQAERRNTETYRWQFARTMMEQAESLLNWGDYDEAERLANQARAQGLNYGPLDASPDTLLARIGHARRQDAARSAGAGVVQATATQVTPATAPADVDPRASHAVYDGANDPTRIIQATNLTPPPPPRPLEIAQNLPTPAPVMDMPSAGGDPAMLLFKQGEAALKARNADQALDYYRQANQYRDQLDPLTRQKLQERLQLLSAPASAPSAPPSLATDAATAQQLLARQVNSDVAHQERRAAQLRESDPQTALTILEQTRARVEVTNLEPAARTAILRRIDRSIAEMRQFIEDNRGRIELTRKNQQTRDEIERDQQYRLEVQEKLKNLVSEYNRLIEEQRYPEAEVVAKQAVELAPEDPVALQIALNAKFIRRVMNNRSIAADKEQGFLDALESVDVASTPYDDRNPLIFPDARHWNEITQLRSKWLAEQRSRRTEREMEIEQKLKTPVSLQFPDAPLAAVLEQLAQLAGVNMYLDPQGFAEEGVGSDKRVSVNLPQDIPFSSALNLILKPHHLSYVIEDDVLKITSEQHRAGVTYTRTYHVADLVVPIPNFIPNSRMGMNGAYNDAMGRAGFNNASFGGAPPLGFVSATDSLPNATIDSAVLAQMTRQGPMAGGTAGGDAPMSAGPGGLGGGANADFDTLIELITTTIEPESWAEVHGGPGQIREYPTNLTLVVTQTEDVHEEIVDLLDQLRRLQDLQVTIEVRFITLNDNFFERIGVDFDFNIDDDIDGPLQVFGQPLEDQTTGDDDDDDDDDDDTENQEPARDLTDKDHGRSVTVGMSAPGVFSADLDIPFTQNSYGLAVPQFGGFDATAGASMGFAILSDIEAFFFINAAQSDRRTNVLQAPKVTLFDGQIASVMDQSQSPFVMGLVPVVGDFAAAQQPVIVILSEGTFLSVQAVVSSDRRFVRLTVVPFFSQIGDVNTFTFTGETTTTRDTSTEGNQDVPDDNTKANNIASTTSQGTTVQLPTYSFVSVSTTVSVPDGGTVLLGGIKRLSEGRTEAGVPILNKIPYISRLFKNVGIGRETQSLMMMVTPRIIIQREEEERLATGSAGS
ncbi:MAG: general secretion pathway protein GspD [Pirellulales bacterium]|nr:general secretion pathway protein GspD [Pirellulales bacterium]